MLRKVYIFFSGGPTWMVPKRTGDNIGYYPSLTISHVNVDDYPAVHINSLREYEALLELNKKLREVFPDETIIVLIPPAANVNPLPGNRIFWSRKIIIQ